MPTLRGLYQDPFSPVLFSSETLTVTNEQKLYIKKILDKACSDSKFAQKAYDAITYVLTGGAVTSPTVTSLVPNSAEIGDPVFTLHVHGTNFTAASIILFNNLEEPTTFVSASELTTGVNMPLWIAPATVPVAVMTGDVVSDSMTFTFTEV